MILDSFAAENFTIRKLYTLASLGLSAPRGHADLLHWHYRIIVFVLSAFGWHVHLHSIFHRNAHLSA